MQRCITIALTSSVVISDFAYAAFSTALQGVVSLKPALGKRHSDDLNWWSSNGSDTLLVQIDCFDRPSELHGSETIIMPTVTHLHCQSRAKDPKDLAAKMLQCVPVTRKPWAWTDIHDVKVKKH